MAESAKSMGGLLAHITAFAAIHFFQDIHSTLESEFGLGVLAVPIGFVVFLVLLFSAARVRFMIIMSDGTASPDEEVWEHSVREAEDDAMALCISNLIALTVQIAVEGPVPEHHHTGGQIVTMVCSGFAALSVMIALACYEEKMKEEHHGHGHGDHSALPTHRLMEIVQLTASFTFAWCMLCSSTWSTMLMAHHLDWTHIWMEVVEAIFVSLTCVFIIRMLDIVADMESTGAAVDAVIKDCVLSFGVLIGFTWEHPFDLGVEEIAAGFGERYEAVVQFGLCTIIAAIVLPAYKWYIVPTVFHLQAKRG
jgi:hypothetical protein